MIAPAGILQLVADKTVLQGTGQLIFCDEHAG
jgi:hypothetical protein